MATTTPSRPGRIRLGVSACLLGEAVRFDGGHKHDRFLTDVLGRHVEWVPVCPEVELGLGVPRDTLRLVGTPDAPRLVQEKTGEDLTARMQRYSRDRVRELTALELDGYVLKRASPSCGLLRVRVYRDNGVPAADGRGLFAEALVTELPALAVEEEGRLNDPALRENFIERVFVAARWRGFLKTRPRARDLVAFHTAHSGHPVGSRIFFASSEDLGFEVSSRKGVPVKVSAGKNDLPAVAASYEKHMVLESEARPEVLHDSPSCVSVGYSEAIDDTWTPSHYSAKRYRALASLDQRRNLRLVPLADLVEFVSDSRGTRRWAKNRLFISVLHVLGEGMLDVDSMLGYEPVTPGIPVKAGDVLLSKINPRIPRALGVPDIDRQLLCSTEFEVMIPRNGEDPYLIAFLLLSAPVQAQIQSLTSGTSASHNRVRTDDLGKSLCRCLHLVHRQARR